MLSATDMAVYTSINKRYLEKQGDAHW